jgi:hypothetical protein
MNEPRPIVCPECNETVTRREFLTAAGGAVAVAAVAAVGGAVAAPKAYATPRIAMPDTVVAPESVVKTLFKSLNEKQRDAVALEWGIPARKMVQAIWAIVKPTIGETFNADQQDMIKSILRGVTNEEWYPKILEQMKGDSGGFQNYHVALFGDPKDKVEFVLTGRHATIRCGGDPAENLAFGGPIFYGHAVKDTEDPTHPGNIFWFQAKQANEVFKALDGKQRAKALIEKAPAEDAINFRKKQDDVPGLRLSELSNDQKGLVKQVLKDLLAPYRKQDVDEVIKDVHANGGPEALSLSFYKQDDLGNDGVWDIWRLEGPAFVWHFRGSPHVHTWVNIGSKA